MTSIKTFFTRKSKDPQFKNTPDDIVNRLDASIALANTFMENVTSSRNDKYDQRYNKLKDDLIHSIDDIQSSMYYSSGLINNINSNNRPVIVKLPLKTLEGKNIKVEKTTSMQILNTLNVIRNKLMMTKYFDYMRPRSEIITDIIAPLTRIKSSLDFLLRERNLTRHTERAENIAAVITNSMNNTMELPGTVTVAVSGGRRKTRRLRKKMTQRRRR